MLLVAVVGALVLVDLAARRYTEARVERSVRDAVSAGHLVADDIDASIDSFPFLGRVLAAGEVPGVTISLRDVGGQGVEVEEVVVDVRGTRIDRSTLLTDQRVLIGEIDSATVDARITEEALSAALGLTVDLEADGTTVSGGGVTSPGTVEVAGRTILIGAPAFGTLVIAIPGPEYLPCDEVDVEVVTDALELRCLTDELPAAVVPAVS